MKRPPSIVRLDQPPALQVLDPQTAWLYTPHTITALSLGLLGLAHHAGVLRTPPPPGDAAEAAARASRNAELGVWAAIIVFLGYSAVHGPRTSMHRPHPVVWRVVHGAVMVYLLFMVWLLFQDVGSARKFLKHLSPTLGVPVEHRSYAVDCRLWVSGRGINWTTISETMDEFVLAHILGWWAKALCVRNYALLWAVSVLFEVMELTFSHMLPNFNECWWDRWVLDVAVCNAVGILLGMRTVRWCECRYEKYHWQGISQLPSLKAKATRVLQQFLPYSWTRLDWMAFSSPARLLQALVVVAVMLTFEVNVFFLKHALWVPPANPLNTYRLVLWFVVALPGTREFYEFTRGERAGADVFRKLGVFAWLAIALTCVETMVSVKFGRGLYPQPWPRGVLWRWGVAGGVAVATLAAWQWRLWLAERTAGRAAHTMAGHDKHC